MNRIAEFGKVRQDIFNEIAQEEFGLTDEQVLAAYENITLPKRATSGSAGYDFYAPFDITLEPGETAKIPTGIRAKMENGWVLMIFPRSGFGFKYRLMLDNTVGVIDSDYYYSDNEGHIMIKVTNMSGVCKEEGGRTLKIVAGQGFAQGVFMPFGITTDDDADGVRNGGLGSTG